MLSENILTSKTNNFSGYSEQIPFLSTSKVFWFWMAPSSLSEIHLKAISLFVLFLQLTTEFRSFENFGCNLGWSYSRGFQGWLRHLLVMLFLLFEIILKEALVSLCSFIGFKWLFLFNNLLFLFSRKIISLSLALESWAERSKCSNPGIRSVKYFGLFVFFMPWVVWLRARLWMTLLFEKTDFCCNPYFWISPLSFFSKGIHSFPNFIMAIFLAFSTYDNFLFLTGEFLILLLSKFKFYLLFENLVWTFFILLNNFIKLC